MLEDVICRYGCVGKIIADCGELNAQEVRKFFERCGVKLLLITVYNPEGNVKRERGYLPIVKALVKACNEKVKEWLRFLLFVLWADRITYNFVTGYMLVEFMTG
ncbi:hypothetical protein GCM10010495_82100 [Kitasatospora herbaricolor]|nr:hypothetical protein GCM10010495_82100 [Kitasatospora herbaricolor]